MKVSITNVLLFSTAATALAIGRRDVATLTSDINTVDADVQQLTKDVNAYSSGGNSVTGTLNAAPILNDVSTIDKAAKQGTTDAQNTGTVSATDAQNLVNLVSNTLANDIPASVNALIAKKSQFDTAGLDSQVVSNLQELKTDADNFAAALIADIPAGSDDITSQANALVAKIDAALQNGINTFS